MANAHILIVGVGGLGKCLVAEALERGLNVSVLVRNQAKLESDLAPETMARLNRVIVGDGTDAEVLDDALSGIDVALSGRGADPQLATALAEAVKRHGVGKLIWPGGTTNVMADDGVTPNFKQLLHLGSWVEGAYRAHGACIDAIRNAGISHMIFCPGRMKNMGGRSADIAASVRINRDAGPFVSYEDAAWVMMEGATTNRYDRQLVSAATKG